MYIQNTNGPFNETGTVCLDLYKVTNCTGSILWRFTKITSSGNVLHYSHYKQCTYAITKKAKKWCKIIPYKESENIATVTSIWRGVFFLIDRELVAMALNPALSKWLVTIVTLCPYKTLSFTDFVILLHWTTLLSSAKHLMPLDNFETNLHNGEYATVLFHHDGLRCPGAK